MTTEQIQNEIIKFQVESIDKQLSIFFTTYFRSLGIKGEITKGKIKWRGIKLKVNYELGKQQYQLNQRGVDVSPILEIVISKHELNKSE